MLFYLYCHKVSKAESNTKMNSTKEHQEWLGKQIVDIAYHLHKALGPGLLEKVYETCFCYELSKREIPFKTQQKVPIIYDGLKFDEA